MSMLGNLSLLCVFFLDSFYLYLSCWMIPSILYDHTEQLQSSPNIMESLFYSMSNQQNRPLMLTKPLRHKNTTFIVERYIRRWFRLLFWKTSRDTTFFTSSSCNVFFPEVFTQEAKPAFFKITKEYAVSQTKFLFLAFHDIRRVSSKKNFPKNGDTCDIWVSFISCLVYLTLFRTVTSLLRDTLRKGRVTSYISSAVYW